VSENRTPLFDEPPSRNRIAAFFIALVLLGCTSKRAPQTIARDAVNPYYSAALDATVAPPAGWVIDPGKTMISPAQLVWISPTGSTAYGVIHFSLPLPVGHELALWGFLREMKKSEGEARLLDQRWDENRQCLRFVAQGGQYTVRTNLRVRGFNGWAAYAGTLRQREVNPDELTAAENARERTSFGRDVQAK